MAAVVGLAGATAFVRDIPDTLRPDLSVAYTDTDGHGQRADGRPPGAARYYAQIDSQIAATTGLPPRDNTVVLTAEFGFLAIYPYWGFQGLTPHYANPLAQFDTRATEIESWADLTTPAQFIARLDALPWPAPTVFLMRRGANDRRDRALPGVPARQLRQRRRLHGGRGADRALSRGCASRQSALLPLPGPADRLAQS